MHALAVLTALATAVSAQSSAATVTSTASLTSASGSSNATSTTNEPVTHTVEVGKGGSPSYSPDVVVAEVGDTIEFQFYPTNHSVIRAAYGYPCVPYEMILGKGHYGFYSGQELVDVVLDNPPSWSFLVNDTDPIFYYCGAPNSCIGNGMVGVVNPNASTSLAHQRQLAESSSFMLLPGQDWPSEGAIPSGVATSSTSATPTPTSATTVTATPIANSSSHGLSGGAIAGIAIGAAVVLVSAGAALWFCGYKSRQPSGPAPGTAPQEIHPGYPPMAAAMYGKPGHMSVVSGYGMPPVYGDPHQGLRSPIRQTMVPGTPVEPGADPHQQQMMHSGSASPNLQPVAPAYGQGPVVNLLAVGTHNIAPVEMDSRTATNRHSLEKQGVERYS